MAWVDYTNRGSVEDALRRAVYTSSYGMLHQYSYYYSLAVLLVVKPIDVDRRNSNHLF